MKRVIVIGCGGAGKSTFSRKLGEKTGISVIHLDKLFWKTGWVSVTPEEFDESHRREIEKDRWILDGNFNRTLPERLTRCDTVVYLDFSRFTCLRGVCKRMFTTYGKVRPDMSEGCPERIDWEFLKWIWNFKKTHRRGNYALLQTATHAQVYILRNRRQAAAFLQNIPG